MTLSGLLAVLTAFYKFPDALTKLVKLLRETPSEQHSKIVAASEKEAESLRTNGRPVWPS
jgi:hypothetical protein